MNLTLQKIAGGVLFALILIKGLDLIIDPAVPVPNPVAEGGSASAPAPAAPAEADKPLAVRLASADPKNGEAITAKCASCHTFNQGGAARVGPNLYGIVGRAKHSVPGFAYSDAVQKLTGDWTYDDLDKWIEKPSAMASGTKMTFAGLPSGQDRADLIAYLKSISPGAPPFPAAPAAAAPAAAPAPAPAK
jgi:cytochrome c